MVGICAVISDTPSDLEEMQQTLTFPLPWQWNIISKIFKE